MTKPRRTMAVLCAGAALALLLGAAAPPTTVNYQGVLRDASNAPLSGTYDMTFSFWNDVGAGNQIMVDQHTAGTGNAVTVSNGLFDVQLGGGTVGDGSGPGTYTDLATVFRDYGAVWLEITVGAETLAPRVRIQSSAYALNATNATQLGSQPGSFYVDTSPTRQLKNGTMRFESADPTYSVLDVVADPGSVNALWVQSGANVCKLQDGTSGVNCTGPSTGVTGYGPYNGGFFQSTSSGAYAYAGSGNNGLYGYGYYGVYGSGTYGVYGQSSSIGVYGSGSTAGLRGSGFDGVDGYGNAFNGAGSYGSGYWGAYGTGTYGTYGSGSYIGAYGNGGTYGVYGYTGTGGFGGYFTDSGGYAYVGDYNSNGVYYKIWGNGTVAFVQNHPEAPDKTIMYAAPEGDEVAVYTRGSAHLVHGEARVPLGETFKWVVNPDIGLTASVTPRGPSGSLYVASVTPAEMVVREAGGASDVAFDWSVWGLRIGYEQMAIVQPKHDYSPVPTTEGTEKFYATNADLRRYDALERFKAMTPSGARAADLSRTQALVAAINRYDANIDGRLESAKLLAEAAAPVRRPPGAGRGDAANAAAPAAPTVPPPPAPVAVAANATSRPAAAAIPGVSAVPAGPGGPVTLQPVAEPVAGGDVVSMDPADGGLLRPARAAGDRLVVGIATAASGSAEDNAPPSAPVAWAGVVACRVDATYGAIAAGDLLVASATPGAAMRAPAAVPSGAVVAKALEPWPAGTGTIRVLVVSR